MKILFTSLCLAAAAVLPPATTAHAQSGVLLKTFNVKAGKLLLDPTRPRLYATLPADNSLAVIDTNSNTVLTTFFVGSNPRDLTISPDGSRLYVANGGSTSAAIAVVDLNGLTTLPSLPAPFAPAAVAAGLNNRLYVLSSTYGSNGIAQIDGTTGTLQTSFGAQVTYAGGFLQISPDLKTLFFANSGSSPSTLASFDVSTATPGAAVEPPFDSTGSNGEALAISHNGKYLVFPNGGGNGSGGSYTTSLIPTNNLGGVVGTFNTGAYPGPVAFSADDSLLYQVQFDGGSNGQSAFKVFNTSTFTQLDSFVDPNPKSTDGYGTDPTSIAVTAPYGYLYVAQEDGTFDSVAGNLELLSTRRAPFFDGSVALSNGFYYLEFANGVPFGYYNFNFSPYLYHSDLGFEYPFDAADGQGGIYLYDFKSKTFWYTSTNLFPYLYDFTLNTFLYYYPDPNNPGRYNTKGVRYFYNFATGKIITK